MNTKENINLSGMMNKRIRISTPCKFTYCGVMTQLDDQGIIMSHCEKYLERDGRFQKKRTYKSMKLPIMAEMKIELDPSNEDGFDDSIKFGECGCDVEGDPMEEPEPVPAAMELQGDAVPEESIEPRLAVPEEVSHDKNLVVIPTTLRVGNSSNGRTIPVFGKIPPPPAGNSNLVPVLMPAYCVVYVPEGNVNDQE